MDPTLRNDATARVLGCDAVGTAILAARPAAVPETTGDGADKLSFLCHASEEE